MVEAYWGQGSKSPLLYEVHGKNVLYGDSTSEEANSKPSSERRLILWDYRGV
ncbi:MAG TPA: hypothetical protein HA314_03890 [Candidatus Thalassarchaeaceae archaeon]|nr:hypothetical protein [Candidatus Thalassarchaeaceae archaeon]HII29156.1 hypothetical protein [Candidatus Thalassarchaeaceae archaeon]